MLGMLPPILRSGMAGAAEEGAWGEATRRGGGEIPESPCALHTVEYVLNFCVIYPYWKRF